MLYNDKIDPRIFAEIAEMFRTKYAPRCHIRTNDQEITIFEETTGKTYSVEIRQKRFKG